MGRRKVAGMDIIHNMHKPIGLAAVTVRAELGAAPARSMVPPERPT